jgi:hypothetical protein
VKTVRYPNRAIFIFVELTELVEWAEIWVLDSSHVLVSVRSALFGFRCRLEEMPESLTSVDSQLLVIEKSHLQGAACKRQDGPQVVLPVNGSKGLMRTWVSRARTETWLSGLSKVFQDGQDWRYPGGGGSCKRTRTDLKAPNHNSELYLVSPYSNF